MSKKDIYVTKPFLPPLHEFLPFLEDIWSSRVISNGGKYHQMLEEELCKRLDAKYISLFCNGTIALMTAIKSLNLKGEVITTPFSFVATSHALVWNNLKPVFVDILPDGFNIDPRKIEQAINENTTAILPVHCYGNICDQEAINKIAQKHNLKVVYDAAHAFGVNRKNGLSIYEYGDLSVLSFHATKVFNTFEGGAIICKDLESKKRIDRLKNFGFKTEFEIDEFGLNGKMSEFNSALGLAQLKHMDSVILKREEIDTLYREQLSGVDEINLYDYDKEFSINYGYFPIIINKNNAINRDKLYDFLKNKNIYSRKYFYPLIPDFEIYFKNYQRCFPEISNSKKLAESVLCLPIYPGLSYEDVNDICSCIKQAIAS